MSFYKVNRANGRILNRVSVQPRCANAFVMFDLMCIVFDQAATDPTLNIKNASHVALRSPYMIRIDIVASTNCLEMFSTALLVKKVSWDEYVYNFDKMVLKL